MSYLECTSLLPGCLVTTNNRQCFISRQYLCQSSLLLAGVILFGLSQVNNYHGYVMFGDIRRYDDMAAISFV